MGINDLNEIFDEVAGMNAAEASADKGASLLENAIDPYCDADASKKASEKVMKASRKVMDEAFAADSGKGTREYFGKRHSVQVTEQKSYSLDQEKCSSSAQFKESYARGRMTGVSLKFHLDFSEVDAKRILGALKAAGLDDVIRDVKHEWKFDGGAAEVRKVMESVEDVNLRDFVEESVVTRVSVKS